MKIVKVINFILKVLNYLICFGGIFMVLGTVGDLETNTITFAQFWLRELIAFAMISFAVIVYIIRAKFNYYFNK